MNTFFYHFQEFKHRCHYLALHFCLIFVVSCFETQPLLYFILMPLKNSPVVVTDLSEYWYTMITLAVFTAFFPTVSFCFYHFWCFFAPGLYKKELKNVLFLIQLHFSLLIISIWFSWSFLIPYIVDFLFLTQTQSMFLDIHCFPKLFPYVFGVRNFVMGCFFVCQVPIFLLVFLKFGMVSSQAFIESRKIAVIPIVCLSAFVSPPEIISQFLISFTLFAFYELLVLYTISHQVLHNLKTINQ